MAQGSTKIRETARAKINLALHITGQRDDGFHLLDTLVTFANFGDVVSVEASNTMHLAVTGPQSEALSADGDNLALRAANGLAALVCETGKSSPTASIFLEKNLPIASGLGGGSADAAATLRALTAFWNLDVPPEKLNSLALTLGADVPMCLYNRPLRARAIGQEIDQVPLPEFALVLVNPRVTVSTPDVFRALAHKNNPPLDELPAANASASQWIDWLKQQRNDLEEPAISIAPEIQNCLRALKETAFARMSGSGATCFGLFDSDEAAAACAAKITSSHRDWWVRCGRTI